MAGKHNTKGRRDGRKSARRRRRRKRRGGEQVLGPVWTAVCTGMFLIAALLISSAVWPDGTVAEIVQWVSYGMGDMLENGINGLNARVQGVFGDSSAKGDSSASITMDGEMIVTFLDVGQGNAVLVECDEEYMLIDGGDREYSSFVVSYLQKQGVEEIKYLVSSHYDADHINGLIGALNVFSVDMVLDGDYEWDTKTYVSFQSAVEENGCEEIHPGVGEVYPLGEAEFTVVCPDDYTHSESNDNSIGLRIVYGETSFLICGDASSNMETWMLESGGVIDSDVLMCSHHGSKYSTSEAFLEGVEPSAVVISCGENNSYGHPSERVMKLLSEGSYDLYRTDVQGTLIASSDGNRILWNTEPTSDYSWRIPD